jgi:bacillithiol biosynthesis deacetylase BshB1
MSNPELDILFTAPHPDDLEIGMGGTIAKMADLGYRVGMLHMTDGEPTPRGTPAERAREAAAAAEILGAEVCETLDLPNRLLMDTPESRMAVATAVRRHRPRILVGMAGRTPAASPDHYQAQLVTEAARFYAQLTKWDERFGGTQPHRVDHLIYRPVPGAAEITHWPSRFVVDITDTLERKLAAVHCYRSQFEGERWERVAHYIRSGAGFEGALAGVRYGETYALPRLPVIRDLPRFLGVWETPPPYERDGGPAPKL